MKISLLMDSNQCKNPSCAKQAETLLMLLGSAVGDGGRIEVKKYCPSGGFASALHAKSWFLDDSVYLGGSYNFTTNAEKNNEEHLVMIKDDKVNGVFSGWFDGLWSSSKTIKVEASELLQVKLLRESRSRSRK